MGYFKDAIRSLTDKGSFIAPILGDNKAGSSKRTRGFIDKYVSPFAGVGSFTRSSAGQKIIGNSGTSRGISSVFAAADPGGTIIGTAFNERGREKALNFMDQGDGDKPPPVGESPGVGSETESNKRAARRRALSAALQRRKRSQTVATSPLGITTGAAIGKKRLGE